MHTMAPGGDSVTETRSTVPVQPSAEPPQHADAANGPDAGVLDDYLQALMGSALETPAATDADRAAVATDGPLDGPPDTSSTVAAMPADDPVATPPSSEPTWDDLPDEAIHETGNAVGVVPAHPDSPAPEAVFAPAVVPTQAVAAHTEIAQSPPTAAADTWQELQERARQAPETPRARRATERSSRWLRLRCGGQTYALELLKVQEVVLPVPLLPLRGSATALLGIMNLRGQVVPVMDLGLHLGTAAIVADAQTRIVVLEENGEIMGLRVSAVDDVVNLSDSQIEPPDTARICRISNDIFRGVARLQQQPMILLDATQLLN